MALFHYLFGLGKVALKFSSLKAYFCSQYMEKKLGWLNRLIAALWTNSTLYFLKDPYLR